MRAFLIDFENVKSAGLTGIEELTGEDQVIILYSVNSNTISFEMHQKIISCRAGVDYFQIRRGGKNSLDFQLSTLLGWLLASEKYSHLYIISNDSGFDALYDFWNSGFVPTDCVVYRRATLAQADLHSKSTRRVIPAEVSADEIPTPEQAALEPAVEVPAVQLPEEILPEEEDEVDVINVIDLFSKPQPAPAEPTVPQEVPVLELSDEAEEDALSLEAILAASPITSAAEEEPAPAPAADERVSRVAGALPAALSEIVSSEHLLRIAGDVVNSRGKQEFYRDIIRRYGQKKGLQVYKTVKSEYTSLKKLADA